MKLNLEKIIIRYCRCLNDKSPICSISSRACFDTHKCTGAREQFIVSWWNPMLQSQLLISVIISQSCSNQFSYCWIRLLLFWIANKVVNGQPDILYVPSAYCLSCCQCLLTPPLRPQAHDPATSLSVPTNWFGGQSSSFSTTTRTEQRDVIDGALFPQLVWLF